MKLELSRFSSHCTLIAVLALVAGIAVTVESAAHHFGLRAIVADRAQNTMVMLLPSQDVKTPMIGYYDRIEEIGFSLGEI